MKYRLQVTTNINHAYEIEADSPEQAEQIYTQYTPEQLAALDLDGSAVREHYPWDVEDVTEVTIWNEFLASDVAKQLEETPAPALIANATHADASPELSAALVDTRALAENPCTGGEFVGFGVYCNDNSGEWIETGFSEEAAAERFAAAWTSYKAGNAARVGLVMNANRDKWEDDEVETIGARCVLRWEKINVQEEQYISLGEYDEENLCDTFGVPDEKIFYYAQPIEFQSLSTTTATHPDGWRIVSYEWVTQ